MVGSKFGFLTVVKKGRVVRYGYLTVHYYDCICDCGRFTTVKKYNLTSGVTKSCGCIAAKKASERMSRHGMSRTRVYHIWSSMKQRCLNKEIVKNNPKLHIYEHTKMSADWIKFENFYKDMGDPPTLKHCIDRVDPFGDYNKDNCRWVTQSENMLNQKRNRELYAAYCDTNSVVSYKLFRRRVIELGWSIEDAAGRQKKLKQYK